MHEKPLEFSNMHENNIFFLCFWNEKKNYFGFCFEISEKIDFV